MGAGSSRDSSGLKPPANYAQAAALAKKLPDEILKIMFATADFKDLLELSSISGCSKYVFSTAKTLAALFNKLQIEPKKGAEGQIYFAPASKLIPGQATDAASRDLLLQRNNLCLQVAYYYIRIFQIYAALAMTVLDTNPTRTLSVSEQSRLIAKGMPKAASGPSAAIFTGGQRGGALSTASGSKYVEYTKQVLQTDFKILQNIGKFVPSGDDIYIQLESTPAIPVTEFKFYIKWSYTPGVKHTSAEGYFFMKGKQTMTVPVDLSASTDGTIIEFSVNKRKVGDFRKPPGPNTEWQPEGGYVEFYQNLYEICEEFSSGGVIGAAISTTQQYRPSSTTGPSTTGQRVGAAPSTASSFERFEEVKRVFDAYSKGGNFPKAYAVGRAMTLLQPIFDQEKTKETPFYSQICRRDYDFDPEKYMPRSGTIASANIYMRSLVALYYDQFQFVGTNPQFSQSETGATELREASAMIAKMFRIDKTQNTFVSTAQTQFAQYAVCQTKGGDVLLRFLKPNSPLLKQVKGIIVALLKHQDDHTKQVNELLKKMFLVKDGKLAFSNDLKNGGIQAVNMFARQAREMLRQYYLRSEAYFTRGVLLFEQMQTEVDGLAISSGR